MKIDFAKIKERAMKITELIARHGFFACLVLFVLALALGSLIFYRFNILSQTKEISEAGDSFLLKRTVYNEVLDFWKGDEEAFNQADSKIYLNVFEPRLTEE